MKLSLASIVLLSIGATAKADLYSDVAFDNLAAAAAFCEAKGEVLATQNEWCAYATNNAGVNYGLTFFGADKDCGDVENSCGIEKTKIPVCRLVPGASRRNPYTLAYVEMKDDMQAGDVLPGHIIKGGRGDSVVNDDCTLSAMSRIQVTSEAVLPAGVCKAPVDSILCVSVPTDPAPTTPANERSGPIDDTFTTKSSPGAKGDPHFKTHGGEMYDFHGGCDLVLVDHPAYKNGQGLTIHIRTKIETWWSYIDTAVLKIGEETLELTGNAQEEGLWVNGAAIITDTNDEWNFSKFAGYVLRYKSVTANDRIRREAHLHLGNGEKILFKTFADFVKVEFMNESDNTLKGSLGLLGTYPEGQRVGRDGATMMEDVNMFGQEWQVKPDEPKLFHSYTADWVVAAGQACAMPVDTLEKSQLRKRRLANGLVKDEIEKACAHLKDPSDHKACVFDVIATQDITMAGAW
ncbi:expressed unknown protein [Seminavis robusta]|uniref:VWFD domain-containing protein n=1 Tax=Seminavis robusta TaxID=568900 RepID=A0A9N8E167_9STRA|nr:expressed unknown protein [Seminavis robusta]|eukprot:Sro544_g163630.1 n/a (462) ;mRNA; f:14796-16280